MPWKLWRLTSTCHILQWPKKHLLCGARSIKQNCKFKKRQKNLCLTLNLREGNYLKWISRLLKTLLLKKPHRMTISMKRRKKKMTKERSLCMIHHFTKKVLKMRKSISIDFTKLMLIFYQKVQRHLIHSSNLSRLAPLVRTPKPIKVNQHPHNLVR